LRRTTLAATNLQSIELKSFPPPQCRFVDLGPFFRQFLRKRVRRVRRTGVPQGIPRIDGERATPAQKEKTSTDSNDRTFAGDFDEELASQFARDSVDVGGLCDKPGVIDDSAGIGDGSDAGTGRVGR
jgi:hypothetical protein